jgi:hypothetical protein
VFGWVIAALAVWSVTRVLRSFFATVISRTSGWFALYVFALAAGVAAGASILFLVFVTWGPLAKAAGRPAEGGLLVAAFVGAVLATAVSVVIGATQKPEPIEDSTSVSLAGRRSPVR